MLKTLIIKNIALIDLSQIEFASGLNILSGETGAGKSIIIDSLNFVLGGRADKTLIRFGETEATVEAEFENINERVKEILTEFDIDFSEGLLISRTMTVEGKNSCRINGIKFTTQVLRQIAGALVDIYGQHENSILLNESTHLGIIDNFGEKEIKSLYSNYIVEFKNLNRIKAEIKRYGSIKDVNKTIKILSHEIEEIKNANIRVGEEDVLAKIVEKIENSEEILSALNNSVTLLNGEMENNALDNVSSCLKELKNIMDFDEDIASCFSRLTEIKIDLQDISSTISHIAGGVDFDPDVASETVRRLDEIRNLESKYGDTEESILAYFDKINIDFNFFSNAEFELIKLNKDYEKSVSELFLKAEALTFARKAAAKGFSEKVENELGELGMPKTKFEVSFNEYNKSNFLDIASNIGVDKLEFMIAPNVGQPLKPLAKIISGGEMSRLMLAIKKISAQIDGVNVMVFDEIDTGISGVIASVVASKLYDISCDRQVLAVTHLPQLASMADNHYLIKKYIDNEQTHTAVELLSEDKTIVEISRLIGGDAESEYALLHASKMKESGNNYKVKYKKLNNTK